MGGRLTLFHPPQVSALMLSLVSKIIFLSSVGVRLFSFWREEGDAPLPYERDRNYTSIPRILRDKTMVDGSTNLHSDFETANKITCTNQRRSVIYSPL